MNRLKKLSILVLLFILCSCSFGRPEDVTELIESPKIEDPILKGTWEVIEIKSSTGNSNLENIKVKDKLYIDNDLVAINNDYAFPPKFSSKFVNLRSYLESRSFDMDLETDKYVKILSANQGQLYSRDFIKLSDNKIFFIQDDCAVILKKIDESVNRSVIAKYTKKASKERTTTTSGEKVEEDICVLIGVRERVDSGSTKPKYYYYTYCIRIEPNKMARIEKAQHIFYPNKQEFWRLKCETNVNSENYNTFKTYPIRLENKLNDKKNKEKYIFKNNDIDLRINFVNEDYISFDYTLLSNDLPINKYAMVKTNDLKKNSFVTFNEYTSDKNSKQVFKNLVYDQINKNLTNFDENKISYDYTNFGLIRNFGLWQFQSSYHIDKKGRLEQKSFPIDIALKDNLIEQDNKDITVDQIKNINGQAKDYFELANGQYVAVQSPDEILFYSIKNGMVDPSPKFSIQLSNSTQIILFEQGLGSYADKWEKTFNEYNIVIH